MSRRPPGGASLKEYAGKNPPRRGNECRVHSLPEREEIDEALREGVMVGTIEKWLIVERGYPPAGPEAVSYSTLNYHKRKGCWRG